MRAWPSAVYSSVFVVSKLAGAPRGSGGPGCRFAGSNMLASIGYVPTPCSVPLADVLNQFNGLPTHALVVHFTVAIATAGAIGGFAYALVPKSRQWLSGPLSFVAISSIVLAVVAPKSGEQLAARVGRSPLIERHAKLGDQMATIMFVYGLVLIVTLLVARHSSRAQPASTVVPGSSRRRAPGLRGRLVTLVRHPWLGTTLTCLVLLSAALSSVWIYRTGEAGTRSVWQNTPAVAHTPSVPSRPPARATDP